MVDNIVYLALNTQVGAPGTPPTYELKDSLLPLCPIQIVHSDPAVANLYELCEAFLYRL